MSKEDPNKTYLEERSKTKDENLPGIERVMDVAMKGAIGFAGLLTVMEVGGAIYHGLDAIQVVDLWMKMFSANLSAAAVGAAVGALGGAMEVVNKLQKRIKSLSEENRMLREEDVSVETSRGTRLPDGGHGR